MDPLYFQIHGNKFTFVKINPHAKDSFKQDQNTFQVSKSFLMTYIEQ
jgi:hypothetical protein